MRKIIKKQKCVHILICLYERNMKKFCTMYTRVSENCSGWVQVTVKAAMSYKWV